jgi:hypothetical protein
MNLSQALVGCSIVNKFIDDLSFKIDYRVQQNVLNAIQHWHQRTCIRFEPYDAQRHSDIAGKITIEDSGSGLVY